MSTVNFGSTGNSNLNPRRTPSVSAVARMILYAAIVTSVSLQVIIDTSLENVGCTFIVGIVTAVTMSYALRTSLLRVFPLSGIMLIGFNAVSMSAALLAQSFNLQPLTANLQSPFSTFLTLGLAQIVVISTHILYRSSKTASQLLGSLQKIYSFIGVFNQTSNLQLWILGGIGFAATIVTSVIFKSNIEFGNFELKLVDALGVFAPAPVLIGMLHWFQPGRARPSAAEKLCLVLYIVGLLIVGLARNSRGQFAVPIAILALAWVMAVLSGRLRVNRNQLARIPVMAACGILCFSVLSDLSTAMLIIRPYRDYLSGTELITRTIGLMTNREAISDERRAISADLNGNTDYSETYVDITFFERFIITKFHDNMITLVSPFNSDQQNFLYADAVNSAVAIFPTPLIKIFAPEFNKDEASHSAGDMIFYLAGRGDELGGRKTGSSLAEGWALFGIWYYALLAMQFMLFCLVFDAMVLRKRGGWWTPLALLQLWFLFHQSVFSDSLTSGLSALLRDLPQVIVLYCAINFLTSKFNISRMKMSVEA